MSAFSRFLIGFGFVWMTLWAIVGSLLGAKINAAIMAGDNTWIASIERSLFRTAHAHMNSMAVVVVLLGLTFVPAQHFASRKTLVRAAAAAVVGVVVFGLGLSLEAFFPPQRGELAWPAAVSALGGIAYILSVGFWGMLFLVGARQK